MQALYAVPVHIEKVMSKFCSVTYLITCYIFYNVKLDPITCITLNLEALAWRVWNRNIQNLNDIPCNLDYRCGMLEMQITKDETIVEYQQVLARPRVT